MALYLVVAHQTAASIELVESLRSLAQDDPNAEFSLLVPATPAKHLWIRVDEDERENARRIADDAAHTLRQAGLVVAHTRVGPPNPLEAVQEAVQESNPAYEAVIVSTLPTGVSRWLRQDLANQVRHKVGLKVYSITAKPAVSGAHEAPVSDWAAAASDSGSDYLSLEALARFRGSEVTCPDGPAGKMTELLYDYASLEPAWIAIASRPIPFRTLLIPATLARLEGGNLVVKLGRQKILDQPHVDVGEGIPSLSDEERLYRYFGLPQASIRELRVLHRHDHLPGTERNYQNILAGEDAPATSQVPQRRAS